ncbi:hypothetical protein [Reichenbachiella sp. MSK19-1]|uniref:hypothetical protein n=1 Tax=Reichenbachiella sp. MSK19-1 TaxID=1897631 RepID=UPI000E6CA36C|nr:hypothetical protein [Reichenbachiella sp. MSK19-1]RJE75222.1 hypothetical protein BGP76_19165 [Reichenbachiella sp. MSK19-1]
MKYYLSELTSVEFHEKLQVLTTKKTNSFKTRLGQFLNSDFEADLVGEIKAKSFVIWAFDYYMTSIIFPILYGQFEQSTKGTVLVIKRKMSELEQYLLLY